MEEEAVVFNIPCHGDEYRMMQFGSAPSLLHDLRKVVLFRELPEEALNDLAAVLQTKQLAAGEVLFQMGDRGDEMFLIAQGRVALFIPGREPPGQEKPIRIVEPGEVLGEMALIDGRPRSLSARALEATQVKVLAGEDFRRLMARYPDMAMSVMVGLCERIRYTTEFLGEMRGWVQRIAAGEYDLGVASESDYRDSTIATLAAEFTRMAARLKEREEELRRQVAELRIEIDQAKKERQVGEIVESEYFQALRAQVQRLRRRET